MRDIQINVRLTGTESEKLETLSKKFVRSKSNTIRFLILDTYERLLGEDRFQITEAGREALHKENGS